VDAFTQSKHCFNLKPSVKVVKKKKYSRVSELKTKLQTRFKGKENLAGKQGGISSCINKCDESDEYNFNNENKNTLMHVDFLAN